MASVTWKKHSSGSLNAGKMERKIVDGVKAGRVWMFSAEPVIEGVILPAEDGSIEVTRVRHVLNPQSGKRQIMVTVKNTGKDFCDYTLYMAGVRKD